jgi:hypothetical protein
VDEVIDLDAPLELLFETLNQLLFLANVPQPIVLQGTDFVLDE